MARITYRRILNGLALRDMKYTVPLKLRAPIATFTFDDFPASAYHIGGALLEKVGARGTYFVCAEFSGQNVDGLDYYTPELLKEIHAKGHEIGSHAFDHLFLGVKGTAFANGTATKNTEFIQGILGDDFMMTSFSYPYGDVSPRVKRAMGKRFPLCRGVHRALNTGSVDLAQISVISLESRHWNHDEMEHTIHKAIRTNSWIVFLTHDVSDSPTPYGSTPHMIESTLQLLRAAEIPILPLKDAVLKAV